jgi:hypothetical protein
MLDAMVNSFGARTADNPDKGARQRSVMVWAFVHYRPQKALVQKPKGFQKLPSDYVYDCGFLTKSQCPCDKYVSNPSPTSYPVGKPRVSCNNFNNTYLPHNDVPAYQLPTNPPTNNLPTNDLPTSNNIPMSHSKLSLCDILLPLFLFLAAA